MAPASNGSQSMRGLQVALQGHRWSTRHFTRSFRHRCVNGKVIPTLTCAALTLPPGRSAALDINVDFVVHTRVN